MIITNDLGGGINWTWQWHIHKVALRSLFMVELGFVTVVNPGLSCHCLVDKTLNSHSGCPYSGV